METRLRRQGAIVGTLIHSVCLILAAACSFFLPGASSIRGEEPPSLEVLIPEAASADEPRSFLTSAVSLVPEFTHRLHEAPEFFQLLNDTRDKVLSTCMQLLATMGPEAHSAAPHVKETALNPNIKVNLRFEAAFVLLAITPEDEPVVGEILAAPNTPLAGGEAYYALGFFLAKAMYESGHTSSDITGLCKVALGEYDKQARLVALNTLENLDAEAVAALPLLWPILQDDDEMVRACAASAILNIDTNPNAELAGRLADRLGWDGAKRKQLLAAADEIAASRAKERDDWRRWGEDVVPELVAMLRHGREAHRRTAMRSLAQMRPAARAAVPSLVDCAAHAKEVETRDLAKSTLNQITPNLKLPPK